MTTITLLAAWLAAAVFAQSPQAVILITLDGARIEEVFGGLDREILESQLNERQRVEDQPVYKRFWADTPEARRQKLMPFFWGTLMRDAGSIAGNPARGSRVHLSNAHWFSYPGYSEILVGRAHDDTIKSNDAVRNPYPTVLEFLQQDAGLSKTQAGAFASWEVFNQIVEHREGAMTVSAGQEAIESAGAEVRKLSALQFETPTPWDSMRHDAYTFRFAMDHLARHRPRRVEQSSAGGDRPGGGDLDQVDGWRLEEVRPERRPAGSVGPALAEASPSRCRRGHEIIPACHHLPAPLPSRA